jgi:mannonate dehydratase
LAGLQTDLADEGLTLIGLEGDPFDMSRIKLGLPGRDEDLERYQSMLREMGRLGLRLLCYNFMAGVGWHRSQAARPGRGGALVSGYDLRAELGASPILNVSSEGIWRNYEYFLRAILPAAIEAGIRLGAHPDDPPLPVVHGFGRIMHSPSQFEQVLALSQSPQHGLTFCQANWKLMGGPDGPATQAELARNIRRFVGTGRVHFVHLRDVRGCAECFEETFHDDGPTNMAKMLRLYHDAGFRGPVRCDHVPTLAGEENAQPGYGTLGRLFADGYLLGLMDALEVRSSASDWLQLS